VASQDITHELNNLRQLDGRLLAPTTAAEAQAVSDLVGRAAGLRRKIGAWLDPLVSQAHAHWKSMITLREQFNAVPTRIENEGKALLTGWHVAEEERVKREQEAIADKAKSEAFFAAVGVGDKALAKAIARGEVAPIIAETPAPIAKIEGSSIRTTWKAEVFDLVLLVNAVVDGKVPIGYVEANQSALNMVAQASKGSMNIPGVRAIKHVSAVQRGGK
jgi:hypothetical protein